MGLESQWLCDWTSMSIDLLRFPWYERLRSQPIINTLINHEEQAERSCGTGLRIFRKVPERSRVLVPLRRRWRDCGNRSCGTGLKDQTTMGWWWPRSRGFWKMGRFFWMLWGWFDHHVLEREKAFNILVMVELNLGRLFYALLVVGGRGGGWFWWMMAGKRWRAVVEDEGSGRVRVVGWFGVGVGLLTRMRVGMCCRCSGLRYVGRYEW